MRTLQISDRVLPSEVLSTIVFPTPSSVLPVLAVNLDAGACNRLSTYPGEAKYLSQPEAEQLREQLKECHVSIKRVPGLRQVLRSNIEDTDPISFGPLDRDMSISYETVLDLTLGSIALLQTASVFDWAPWAVAPALAVGGTTAVLAKTVRTLYRKAEGNRCQQSLKKYDTALNEARPRLIPLGDKTPDEIKRAIVTANSASDALTRLNTQGLTTDEDAQDIAHHLGEVIHGYIQVKNAEQAGAECALILEGITSEQIEDDSDLQRVRQQRKILSDDEENGRDRMSAAQSLLEHLQRDHDRAARLASAQVQAARFNSTQ